MADIMMNYKEMKSSTIREIEGVKYHVRKFGMGGKVFEEALTPIPTVRNIRTMNPDGTEDISKLRTEDIN